MNIKIEKKINTLNLMLNKWIYEYYVLDDPSVSDYEYDEAYNELVELEQKFPQFISANSPTKRVGGKALDAFKKFDHTERMLSLSNLFSRDDLLRFNNQIKDLISNEVFNFYTELKMDGLAVCLIYKYGKLSVGATRGDGMTGEDITQNVKMIHEIPLYISEWEKIDEIEIRGEVFFKKIIFEKINMQRAKKELELFKNPRNAVAGTMRQLDPNIVLERQPSMMVYGATNTSLSKLKIKTLAEFTKVMKKLNFRVSEKNNVGDLESTWKFIAEYEKLKNSFKYDIDGIVVKVNQINLHTILGSTIKFPRWSSAYKFKANEVETKLVSVEYQVGRTGTITPVGILIPILIDGSTVSRATLNNKEMIEIKDLKINDFVIIRKAGEIIPEVVKPIVSKRDGTQKNIIFPTKCPSCSEELIEDKKEVAIRCINPKCPAKSINQLIHFVSRNALNIDGMGAKIIEKFYNLGLINDITSIFTLKNKRQELYLLEGLGEKSINNLLNSIELSKKSELSKVLVGFGIRHIGTKASLELAKKYQTIDNLLSASNDELEALNDFGPEMTKSFIDWKNDEKNLLTINKLKQIGFTFQQNTTYSSKFNNLNFVITGTFENYKREELKTLLEENGGKVTTTVSKNTNYLFAGIKAGSKLAKAKELNIKILDEKEITEFIT